MRRRMLQGLNVFFHGYLRFIAVLWFAFVVLHFILAFLVFPTTRGSIWYGLAGTTVGCIVCMVVISVLKALFHKSVIRALDTQQVPSSSSGLPVPTLVDAWRRIVVDNNKSWVLFRNGTCVVLMQPQADLRRQAIELMREWGPIHSGSPAGDFSVVTLTGQPGWVVTCHHKDILTYVAPEETLDSGKAQPHVQQGERFTRDGPQQMASKTKADLAVGLFGRSKRDRDAAALDIIHVEDKRTTAYQDH